MTNTNISFIILSHDEEIHLPRLLDSISSLHAATYVLDSFSTDRTIQICSERNIPVVQHAFYNHPTQWHFALQVFKIDTPWLICLDADQTLSDELVHLLRNFKDEDYQDVDGIYFNRKNYFKGKWIKHGGYYPKYLLKMFRYEKGWSDLNENMDHRFLVPGKTKIWKSGHLIEENLKENNISFWISKHNRYSDLLAKEELQNMQKPAVYPIKPSLFGAPNNRKLWLKSKWSKLPIYLRPVLYFLYRLILRAGFRDGKTGIIFHFLQAFWFRLIVDIKLEELQQKTTKPPSAYRFLFNFFLMSLLFYGFNIAFIGISTPGGRYVKWTDEHINFIKAWREFNITVSKWLLQQMGHIVQRTETGLTVSGRSGFRLIYSCLGYGIMSVFSAFVIAFPKPRGHKFTFLISGLLTIQSLNIIRLVLIALFFKDSWPIDHHLVFSLCLYLLLSTIVYKWINKPA